VSELYSEHPGEKKGGKPSLGDGSVTTPSFEFIPADVISAECTVGDKLPVGPVGVSLELSTDNLTFHPVESKSFGYLVPEKTYRVGWALSLYETQVFPSVVSDTLSGGWKNVRLKFIGDASLSISAHSALDAPESKAAESTKKPAAGQPAHGAAHR
jgi:hypothetical protein